MIRGAPEDRLCAASRRHCRDTNGSPRGNWFGAGGLVSTSRFNTNGLAALAGTARRADEERPWAQIRFESVL
jgi:hypothetical protein